MLWLTGLFALVALIYASVGFGGGSTYTALLSLWGVEYQLIPVISLLCNIIVVTGGSIRFVRAGLISWPQVLPMLMVSAPLAFLGGMVPLKQWLFLTILGAALLASAGALLLQPEKTTTRSLPKPVLLTVSGAVGLLAGLSGIGGGIFMAPVLHLMRWADGRRIAAFACIYILVNSIAGLLGQLAKQGTSTMLDVAADYGVLLIAVLIGGQIGGLSGLRYFPPTMLRMVTALLVGYAAIRLLWQAYGLT